MITAILILLLVIAIFTLAAIRRSRMIEDEPCSDYDRTCDANCCRGRGE